VGQRPATYTLQDGEFPYCIARRFDVDPVQLLSLSGLSDGVLYPPGTQLRVPQSGSFPGTRALRNHPTTYSVTSGETIYGVACAFGDVRPEDIASANGLSAGAALTAGQQLNIP
jgi:LysM repeat protein